MATTLLQVAYRPVRVGWLVRGRSKNDLRDMFRLASCLWGGMFGMVADPVGDPEGVDAAIRRFRTDVLHSIAETDASRALVERHRHLAWPLIGHGIVSSEQPEEPGLLDLSSALRLYSRGDAHGTAAIPVWDEADEMALVYAATFGDLTHPTFGPKQRVAFTRVTGAEDVPAAAVADAFDLYECPLDATLEGLLWRAPRVSFDDVPGVFIGSATSLADVRAYWNTRAIGIDLVFWDLRHASGGPFHSSIERRVQAAVMQQQGRPDNFRLLPCYVRVRTPDARPPLPVQLQTLIQEAGLLPTITSLVGDIGIARRLYRGVGILPALPDESVVVHTEDRGEEQSRATIELPRTPLIDRDRWPRQEVAVQIETYGDSGYRGTLKLPYLPDLNSWYRWNMAGALEYFRVQDEAFALITSMLGPTLDVTPLPPHSLLAKLFERSGITASRSLPGEAAWHLLLQFGGYRGIRVLRLPGVRKLMSSTAARSGITRKAARDRISDGGRITSFDRIWIGGDQLNAGRVWEYLLQRRIFLPGIETKCHWCQHSSFYRPRDVEDELQCPKCGRSFPLGPAIAGDPVRFRMSGLLEPRSEDISADRDGDDRTDREDRSSHQPAAVPVLLTLLFLSEWTGGGDGEVFDTSHDLTGDELEKCETDFIAITYGAQPDQHTHILVGECKGRGRVNAEDIRKLSAVAARLNASGGVKCDVVFSTTRDSFTEEELELFRRYHENSSEHAVLRRAPILLTANELDFDRHAEQSQVGHQVELGATGFDGLVRWSTEHLVGRLDVPTLTLEPVEGV